MRQCVRADYRAPPLSATQPLQYLAGGGVACVLVQYFVYPCGPVWSLVQSGVFSQAEESGGNTGLTGASDGRCFDGGWSLLPSV